jgi:hypothetical protein
MNNNDHLFNALRLSLRSGNMDGLEFHLERLLKKAQESVCALPLRTEIYLEAVKSLRALDRHTEAVQLCDRAISNISADSFDLLSALKRLRSLLFLDAEDFLSARNLIEETDGLELVLQDGQSVINRSDAEVAVETWLVSMEIALAQRDIPSGQTFFEKAVSRLSSEEAALRRGRISFPEKKKLEQYYHDLSRMLTLYGLTLRLVSGENQLEPLEDLCHTIAYENEIAASNKRLPNVPLYLKLSSLLGKWSVTAGSVVLNGIPLAEARRWAKFGSPDKLMSSMPVVSATSANSLELATSIAPVSLPGSEAAFIQSSNTVIIGSEAALNITANALEKMADAFSRIERVLPDFETYLRGGANIDYTRRGFSGHLLDTDLHNFLHNIHNLRFTGYLKLVWKPDLYRSAIAKGYLPELLRCGEACLYALDGHIVDVVFVGQNGLNTLEMAQDNLVLIVRMCFVIDTDDTRPDIIGTAVPEAAVQERQPLISISHKNLVFLASELEELAFGIRKKITYFDSSKTDDIIDAPFDFGAEASNQEAFAAKPESDFSDLNMPEDAFQEIEQTEKPHFKPAFENNTDILEI